MLDLITCVGRGFALAGLHVVVLHEVAEGCGARGMVPVSRFTGVVQMVLRQLPWCCLSFRRHVYDTDLVYGW